MKEVKTKVGLYRGKPLEKLSREELYKIIEELSDGMLAQSKQFLKDLMKVTVK